MNMYSRAAIAIAAAVWLFSCVVPPRAEFRLRRIAVDPSGGADSAISPDGRYFLTSSKRTGNLDVWMYEVATEKWTQLTNDRADDFEAQWSPDGKRVVFTSNRSGNKDIYVLDLATRSVQRLTSDPEDDEYPNFSPDGKWIVYTSGPWKHRDYYVVPSSGGPRRNVTNKPGMAGACSFYSDGRSLICHDYELGSGHVSMVPLNGDRPTLLTSGDVWDYKPTSSSNGKWLAFSRAEEDPSRIWIMPLAGADARPITNLRGDDRWPTWTARGDIFFHRIVDDGTAIRMLDRKTGEVRTIVNGDEHPGQASLDPAGLNIVYGAVEQDRRVLRIRGIHGGEPRTLDLQGGEAAFPRWAPDGKRIAFALKKNARWQIATMDAAGSNLHIWTESLAGTRDMSGVLDWLPDGKRIVFHAGTHPFESDLFLLDTGSGETVNLTRDAWFDESPASTADGKGIIFMSTRGGNWTWGFYRLDLADRSVHPLTSPDYVEKNFPRPNARGDLLFSMYAEDGAEYLAERTADGTIAMDKRAGAWARWPSYSPDGRFIVYTSREHRVEYWLAEGVLASDSPVWETRAPRQSARCPIYQPVQLRDASVDRTLRLSPVSQRHR